MNANDTSGVPSAERCALAVPPEEVAAWAVDGEPYDGADLEAHVPTCPACQAVVLRVAPTRQVGERLRAAPDEAAPASVVDRALGRVRAERTAWLLARTLGGALARVGSAALDYATAPARDDRDTAEFPPPLADDLEDTGELPGPDG